MSIAKEFPAGIPLQTALCLRNPGEIDEIVIHLGRETGEDHIFLFEALDDASDYANEAQKALTFLPAIGRVRLIDLHFKYARFKPAVGDEKTVRLRP